jgi:membrane-associated phospholipid phosphatase
MEVKRLGGVGSPITPTARNLDQTLIGIFWSYDGSPFVGAPPRLYNQIAVRVADEKGTDEVDLARLLALVNVAMADAAIAVWDSKYHYLLWRPVTGIREAECDDNPLTAPDPFFTPLGAQASNAPDTPDFTPPFPAYPSGHAGLGAATFHILRRFYGTDEIPFDFVSDELNGVTLDFAPPYPPITPAAPGDVARVRPEAPRHYSSLSEATQENSDSRIYLGVHWRFDQTAGEVQGRKVARHVFEHVFRPY